MGDKKTSVLTEITVLTDDDLIMGINDPGSNPETVKMLAPVVRDYAANYQKQTQYESDNSVTPLDFFRDPGETFRYMTTAQQADVQTITASIDVTTAVQNAINSGHPCRPNDGLYRIDGDLVMASDGGALGGKHFIGSAGVRFERFANNTNPILQIYGVQNRFEGNGMQFASRTFSNPKGIVLVGPDPAAADASGADQVSTTNNWIDDIKIIGQVNTTGIDGSIGLYTHSAARKRGVWITPAPIVTFYNNYSGIYVIQVDKSFEFSSDANANSLVNCTALTQGTACVMFNASYGNSITNLKYEKAIGVDATNRYVVHFGEQNYSVSGETGTDAAYPINGALDNRVHGWAETLNTATQVISLFTIVNPPSSGTQYGGNEIDLNGIQPAGQALGGSTAAVIYDTFINSNVVFANHYRPMLLPGELTLVRLDDDSGGIRYENGTAYLSGTVRNMAESFTYDLFSWDNIGPTSASGLIELTIQTKDSTGQDHLGGTISFMCPVTASTARQPLEIVRHFQHFGNDDEPALVPIVTFEAGTDTDTGMFTVKLATQVTTGVGEFFCDWDAKLVSSELEGTGIDWPADISLLTSSTSELIVDDKWARKTKFTLLDTTITNDASLTDDPYLNTWDLDADTEYLVEGQVEILTFPTPDFQCNFDFSQATQDVRISITEGSGFQQQITDAGVVITSFSLITLFINGKFTTNATTGGDVSFRWAQNVSDAATTIVRSASWIKMVRFDAIRSEIT